jgi:hypothetical protein
MKKLFIILSGFFVGVIFFIPKQNLFYLLQKELQKNNIYINTSINSNPIKLSLKNSDIFVNGINIAKFKNANIYLYLFYNKITISQIKIDIGDYLIKKLNIIHSILDPTHIKIDAIANFGQIEGDVNILNRELKIYITHLKSYTIKKFLKKDKKGYYYYAKF